MADSAPALGLTSLERSNVTRNLLVEALNGFPEAIEDDLALAVALACVVDAIERTRPSASLRMRLRLLLDHPVGARAGG